jgi:alkylhydroperoxidase family enzyme
MTTGITALRQLRPDSAQALDDALARAAAADPDGLLELCRARVRTLLGGQVSSDDPRLLAVGDYAHSDRFTDTERLAVEFAEQYVLDVANMPDDLVAALRERLGTEGLYAFAMGLYAIDQAERLDLSAAVHPGVIR